MKIAERLAALGLTQAILAKIISEDGESVTRKARIKAHRIWHGSKPNQKEIKLIYAATSGTVDANFWHEISTVTRPKKHRSSN